MSLRVLSRLLLVAVALPLGAQTSAPVLTAPLPIDPKVKIGTLPNGIRYYIRRNVRPEKRAELRLVVNAGSVLENEDQLGYAHFLEHTAFNGTTHFAKNDLVKYLQSIGVRFGADLNAYTSFDQTVYILPVPTDTAALVEKGFQILEDWAHGQRLDSMEVVNERGVVREEWRGSKGAGERMLHKLLPVALKGSRYAERLPIGNETSIMRAQPSVLRRFYADWYRPDLMAVIAVGDFDPARIEAQIKRHFSSIRRPARAKPRTEFDVPNNAAPLVAIATDKEATSSQVQVTFKMPAVPTRTVGDYRTELMAELYTTMLNSRFNEIAQKPDAPFLGAGADKGQFLARATDGFTLAAGVKDGGIERGLEALLLEARRVDQYGYLQSELDRAKQNMLRSYERANAERDKTNSGAFVEEYIGNYLEHEAIPGIEKEYELVQQLLPTITLAEVNAAARKWITDENRVVVATAPDKPGIATPTVAELLAVFDRTAKAPLTAYAENVSGDALLDKLPAAGSITARRDIAGVGVIEWTLSNGARVLVKPTDFKADEIVFSAYANGGTSLAADSNFMSASLASQIVALSGVGKFNRVDLGKKLAGKAVSVTPSINETTEGLTGSASPKDLETLFQLANLYFTAPRLDTAALQAFRNQVAPVLANRGSDPGAVFQDTIRVTLGQHSFRARPVTPGTFAEVNEQRALTFYRERYADAGNFTFVFVGNVDTTTLRPLVERYLASLPSTGRKESWRNVSSGPPSGVVSRLVRKGIEPKATTLMVFTGPFTYTPENRTLLRGLVDYLQIKLTETLREKLGGTYSPSVGGGGSRVPRAEYSLQISYSSSPENVETLAPSVLALIDTLKRVGPTEADVEKVRAQTLRARETALKQNAFWLTNIAGRDQAGEDLAGLLDDSAVRKLTPAQIQAAARLYLNTNNYAKFVLLPEEKPVVP
ncbi:MAG TPA: insulinase family protein [Gemmatimonadaceae bacterium]|nr:insulinase family protein [Gemmatimonadaceae bacterium]